jgi:hypothetical protein
LGWSAAYGGVATFVSELVKLRAVRPIWTDFLENWAAVFSGLLSLVPVFQHEAAARSLGEIFPKPRARSRASELSSTDKYSKSAETG